MADFPFQYAAKFLCTSNIPGTSQTTTSLLPGNYQTVVNIHNPNGTAIRFRMKLALASLESPQISNFIDGALKPDQAGKIDCSDLGKFGLHLIHGFEGFLVIESMQATPETKGDTLNVVLKLNAFVKEDPGGAF